MLIDFLKNGGESQMSNVGMDLLFIHGAGGTKSKWREMKKYFPGDNVRFVDLPGRGGLPLVTSIEDHAHYLNEQIKTDTVVIGHSMGGIIGLELASLNEHVKGLVLVASFYELPVHPQLLEAFSKDEFPESLMYASFNKDVSPSLIEREKKERSLIDPKVAYADFRACNEYKKGKNRLENLTIPILFIYGDEDRLIPEHAGDQVQSVNKHVAVRTLPNKRHYIILEDAKEVSSYIEQFYNEYFTT